MSELEFYKSLILSTAHMTLEDSERLGANDPTARVSYEDTDYGWSIFVGTEPEYQSMCIIDAQQDGYSGAFIEAIKLAQANDCQWIRFDCDGPVIDQLPEFDW